MNDNTCTISPDTVTKRALDVHGELTPSRRPQHGPRRNSNSNNNNNMSTTSMNSGSFLIDEDEVMMTLLPARKKSHSFHPNSSPTPTAADVEARQLVHSFRYSNSGDSLIDVTTVGDVSAPTHVHAGHSSAEKSGRQGTGARVMSLSESRRNSPSDSQAEFAALQGASAGASISPRKRKKLNKRTCLMAYRAMEDALREEEDAARSEADAADCAPDGNPDDAADAAFGCYQKNYCCDQCDGCSQCCLQIVEHDDDFLNYSEEEERTNVKHEQGRQGIRERDDDEAEGRNDASAAPRRVQYDGGFFVNHNNQSERIEFLLDHLDLTGGASSSEQPQAAPTKTRLALPKLASMEDDGEDDSAFNEGQGCHHGQHQKGNHSSLSARKKSSTAMGHVATLPSSLSVTRSFEVTTW
jgi:hypothetical protein